MCRCLLELTRMRAGSTLLVIIPLDKWRLFKRLKSPIFRIVLVADQSKLTEVEKHWIPLTLGSFGHLRYMSETDVQTTGNKLKAIYSSGDGLTTNDLVNLFSDLAFNRGARLLTELHSYHGSPVYPYMVTHEGGHSIVLAAGLERNGDSLLCFTRVSVPNYFFFMTSAFYGLQVSHMLMSCNTFFTPCPRWTWRGQI